MSFERPIRLNHRKTNREGKPIMYVNQKSTKIQSDELRIAAAHRREPRDGSPSTVRLWLRGTLGR